MPVYRNACSSRKIPCPPHGRSLEIPRGEGGSEKPKLKKQSMKLNWNSLGRGDQNKNLLGGVWIFSGITQWLLTQRY